MMRREGAPRAARRIRRRRARFAQSLRSPAFHGSSPGSSTTRDNAETEWESKSWEGCKKREQYRSSVRGRALAERMYAMKGRLAAEDVWPAVFSCAVIALVPSARS
jgi:hypothetical protein